MKDMCEHGCRAAHREGQDDSNLGRKEMRNLLTPWKGRNSTLPRGLLPHQDCLEVVENRATQGNCRPRQNRPDTVGATRFVTTIMPPVPGTLLVTVAQEPPISASRLSTT